MAEALRDLRADLALCERVRACRSLEDYGGVATPWMLAAMSGWPEAIERALAAEELLARIDAADDILAELSAPERVAGPGAGLAAWLVSDRTGLSRVAGPGAGLAAWLASDRTGLSSRYMAHALSDDSPYAPYAHPHDPEDFGRCVGLLDACPDLREGFPRLRAAGGSQLVWAALVADWDALEALYREESPTGAAPRLYARMRAILDAAGGRTP